MSDDLPGKSDHLKYYCIIFSVLIVVIAVFAMKQRSTLHAYQRALKQAQGTLTKTGRSKRGRPFGVGDLAVEVEKFVKGYKASVGGEGEGEGISDKRMERAEMSVNMKNIYAARETTDPNQSKGYRTRSREFTYGPSSLEQLTKLVWNIENMGLYRVYEIRWKLADEKTNSKPPFNLVNKPVIRVGYRQPLTRQK